MSHRPRRALRALVALAFALTGVGLGAGAAPAQAAPSGTLDLVLLLDGSGSIDRADWDLQLQGYAAALRDRTNFPVDGSVAVSVIQWSYYGYSSKNTRVEVPLTVLDSPAAADEVARAVLEIDQMGNNTNPGDAIVAATQELSAHGRSGAGAALCMSTDGALNDGVSLSSATSTAKTAGVDKFSVVAIQDGSFGEAQARSAYGPYVFGGGQVTVARTTTEFTTMIAGCAGTPLKLDALEVTQGLQDLNNTVPVVTTRDTLVRAYLATPDASSVRVNARLHVTRNGSPIPGSPFTAVAPYTPVPVTGVMVDGSTTGDRAELARTLNFRIPAAQATGTWDLRLEYAGGLACDDQAQNPTCGERVTFRNGVAMRLVTVAVGTGKGTARNEPSQADLSEQAARVKAMLPVSTFEWEPQWIGVNSKPTRTVDFLLLDARLNVKRLLEMPGRILSRPTKSDLRLGDTRYLGIISGPSPAGAEAVGFGIGTAAAAYDGGLTGMLDNGWDRSNGTHEVMHTYGVNHPANAAANGYTRVYGLKMKRGWCGEAAFTWAPEYPYTGRSAQGRTFAAMGPLGSDARTHTWGAEVRLSDMRTPLALVNPTTTPALMSYCPAPDASSQVWNGVPDWTYMIDLFSSAPAPTPTTVPTPRPAPSPNRLLRAAMVDGEATMMPALPLDAEVTPDDPEGTHAFALLDAEGAPLHEVQFTPEAGTANGAPVARDASLAEVVVPDLEGVASIEFRAGDDVLATVPVTANAPEVSVQTPTAGSQDRVTFTWDATDADGGALAHTVRYSADDGETWTTMAVDLDDASVSVPRWALAGSDAARLQVITSDGVNTDVETSAAFAMPNLAPAVVVGTPEDEAVVSGAQTVVFSASAVDAEDGDISGDLVWSSDLDGRLGTGATLTRRADELSEGTHQITVTSTDAGGATSSATVALVVYRIAPVAPEPDPATSEPTEPTEPTEPPADAQGSPGSAAAPAAPAAPAGHTGSGLAWTGWTPLPWCIGAVVLVALGAGLVWGRSRARRAARA